MASSLRNHPQLWHAATVAAFLLAQVARAAAQVTFSTIASNAYATGDINSCAVGVNSLTTVGGFEFAAYYDLNRNVMIARRTTGSSTWSTFGTGLTVTATEITDDHNIIAIAVDSTGIMHLSYNMHNTPLRYATSNASVLGALGGTSVAFTTLTSINAPTLFPNSGTTTNEVTYPQFYPIPGSPNLLFTFRNGGTGGGSGNGNNYVDIYDPAAQTWSQTFVLNGMQTSVNGYTNSFAYDSTGKLVTTWTWRASPDWRTNFNIMYAQSPDNGVTWQRQDGTPYGLPIVQAVAGPLPLPDPNQVAQIIQTLPQGSGLINQTSSTVDRNDRPIIATWWAPAWVPTAFNMGSGDPNRQYMLEYYDGSQWRTSQITNRTSDTTFDTTGANVRDLGRPIVVVDASNRVLVLMRYEDSGIHIVNGINYNPANPGNNLVVAYTNDLITGNTISHWNFFTLDSANMGSLEPTYDPQLWAAQNKLALIYEPVGLSGTTSTSIQVLEWDAHAYFASLITSSLWNGSAGNWSDAAKWSTNPQVSLAPNNSPAFTFDVTISAGTVTLDINPTIHALTLSGAPNAWTAKLDLTNNNLIVANGPNIPNQLKQGANLGAWNGPAGITSSSAQSAATGSTATALAYATGAQFTANNGQTTFSGLTFNPTDTLIMYTLAGDANMDQSVTFADFLQLQNQYNQPNTDWQGGDFNYDNSTTFADFLILQNNYNKTLQPGNLSRPDTVPEPASMALLAWGAAIAICRGARRRTGAMSLEVGPAFNAPSVSARMRTS